MNGLEKIRRWLTMGAVIVLCCIPFFRSYDLRDRPLCEDEIYWIGQAYYYHLAFERMDWSNPDWQLLPATENPALGKFVIGLGLRLNGLSVTKPDWLGVFYIIAKDRPNAWGQGRDHEQRQAVINRMEPATRELAVNQDRFDYPVEFAITARAVMLVFGALSVVAIFVLASLYMGRVASFLAASGFALHPAVVNAYTEVGVDILAIAFSLVAVVHFVLIERSIWRRSSRPKSCRALVCGGGGLSLALAVGSKMNAVVVGFLGVMMLLFFAVLFFRRRSDESKESCKAMSILLVISLVAFVVLNPVNYPNPVAGVWKTYADQQRSLEVQKSIPAIRHPLQSVGERIQALAVLTAFHPAVFALIVCAFVFQLVENYRARKPLAVIALWWFVAVVMVTAWLPFARSRYVLPVIAPSIILLCAGSVRLVNWVRHKNQTNTLKL